MARNKMVRVLMGDGVPTLLNFKPSSPMLAAMRAAMSTSRAYVQEHEEATALAYATWLAKRDGVEVPKVDGTRPARSYSWSCSGRDGVLVFFEWDWVEGERRARVRAVRWESGSWAEYRDVQRMRRGKPVTVSQRCEPYWVTGREVLRIDIPNWDHVATATELAQSGELAA
jgi:hypothetical protein